MKLHELFTDHIQSLVVPRLIMASHLATDSQWTSIRGCLSSKYKFTLDRESIAGILGPELIPHPILRTPCRPTKGRVDIYVKYVAAHEQTAALMELLNVVKKSTHNWSILCSGALADHRFTDSQNVLGVISLIEPVPTTLLESVSELYLYPWKTLQEYILFLKDS